MWAAGAVAALLVFGSVGIDLASAVRARHLAEAAADLSALAAAGRVSDGERAACAVARATADRNGAVLRDCRLDGWDAVVRVEVDRAWTLVGRGPAGAAARAGPVPVDTTPPSIGPAPDGTAPDGTRRPDSTRRPDDPTTRRPDDGDAGGPGPGTEGGR